VVSAPLLAHERADEELKFDEDLDRLAAFLASCH
jgi:hypothetical protein